MIMDALEKLVEGRDLSFEEAAEVMGEIMKGGATCSQIGAFLTALRMKSETIDEISAFASVMRKHCRRINPKVSGRLVDTCGTGGDRIDTFNISTAAAFVAAGAGVNIAKHGNRSVTSMCGSADVIQELGFNLGNDPETVEKIIENIGMGFMFAPSFHPAMKHAIGPRRELGIRTVFNVLGPLTNPAGADSQLLGVYNPELTEQLAKALMRLGCEEAMVVHGMNGLDEISTLGATRITWLKDCEIKTIETVPKDFGVVQARPEDVRGMDPKGNAELTFRILNGLCGLDNPKVEIVLVNGVAGIVISGKANDFLYGMELARESIESGAAYGKLRALVKASGGDLTILEELESKYG